MAVTRGSGGELGGGGGNTNNTKFVAGSSGPYSVFLTEARILTDPGATSQEPAVLPTSIIKGNTIT